MQILSMRSSFNLHLLHYFYFKKKYYVQNNKLLHRFGSQLINLESDNSNLSVNIRLLRTESNISTSKEREKWKDTFGIQKTSLGSLVNAIPSTSTWKRKATI
jgi:hypothetical protein